MRFRAGNELRSAWVGGIKASGPACFAPEQTESAATPLHPARVAAALRQVLPRDGAVVVDSGSHRAFFAHYFPAYGPRTYFAAVGHAPMPRETLARLQGAFAKAGFPLTGLTLEPFAHQTLLRRRVTPESAGAVANLHVGQNWSRLEIFSNGNLMFVRVIKTSMTFASALRSTLRQDPDVVLVGEIRDAETASIATQAALTGHKVLSTVHTNDAAGAVMRLMDMRLPAGTDQRKILPFIRYYCRRYGLDPNLVRAMSRDYGGLGV